ncbi:MAG: hypothetical protein BHW64_04810 [Candidatus Melainabacteria bacterium LEY3_CP_29_8]|nr:MAG: hypothetical protein BHW64_04810 [Candidatus Melainabacteria bacterium LEY3_CP_29_8]
MKKRLSLLILILFFLSNGFASAELVIDDSIHNEIKKEYDLDNLPPLPKTSEELKTIENRKTAPPIESVPIKYTSSKKTAPKEIKKINTKEYKNLKETKPKEYQKVNSQPKTFVTQSSYTNRSIKLNSGKTFDVKLMNTISSKSRVGTNVVFASIKPQTFKYITIPIGTMFYGKIVDAHSVQYTGNGGLIVVKVHSIKYKNKLYPLEAKVTLADDKHIFFNNIKGRRMYLKNMYKKTSYGRKTVRRTLKSSKGEYSIVTISCNIYERC